MAKRKAPLRQPRRKRRGASRTARARPELPKDALTRIVICRAREGQEALLEAELRALVAPTRKEEGCLRYELHRGADLPSVFLLHEVWASREHHRRHTLTPHFVRWNARKDALLASRDASFWLKVA